MKDALAPLLLDEICYENERTPPFSPSNNHLFQGWPTLVTCEQLAGGVVVGDLVFPVEDTFSSLLTCC